jgi:hypothetical protein
MRSLSRLLETLHIDDLIDMGIQIADAPHPRLRQ